ncbi:MAG: hypothetical protein L0387_02620 [Acidobacteria bacterium]|nr:hypothetical protein [Acidobacteriota bacterium]
MSETRLYGEPEAVKRGNGNGSTLRIDFRWLSIIIVLIAQIGAAMWWAGGVNEQVRMIREQLKSISDKVDSLDRDAIRRGP